MTLSFLSIATAQIKIPLWEGTVPGNKDTNIEELDKVSNWGSRVISKISIPELSFYKSNKKGDLPAIIICPGGGYGVEAFDHEGIQVAQWLNSIGAHAFVLKYRLPDEEICLDPTFASLTDALEAIKIVKANAENYDICDDKVGIMGFSAGGHLAASASTLYHIDRFKKSNNKADFSVLIYPVISMQDSITHKGSKKNLLGSTPDPELVRLFSTELQVTEQTPPAFILHAADDKAVQKKNSEVYADALSENGVEYELTILENGGHGFGFNAGKETNRWTTLLEEWLISMKIIE